MQIHTEPLEEFTILHLRGEFDTFQCPYLQEEIDELINAGENRVALNLRHVKFINSTALGAIIKASKDLTGQDGSLVISRPSPFCRQVMDRVGLDRAVPIFDSDEDAGRALIEGAPEPAAGDADDALEEETTLLFTPVDPEHAGRFIPVHRRTGPANPVHKHRFGELWCGIGRMTALDDSGLRFLWNGGKTGLSTFEMGQMFAIGTPIDVKFHVPYYQKGFCRAVASIRAVEERPDGVKLTASFTEIDDKTHQAVQQYESDIAFLKEELRRGPAVGSP